MAAIISGVFPYSSVAFTREVSISSFRSSFSFPVHHKLRYITTVLVILMLPMLPSLMATLSASHDSFLSGWVELKFVTIIEHFTGRYSDNSENIRTVLQNLRCKTLTDFRWYKDTFLNRVMELPECNSPHWKSKFIDGLLHYLQKGLRKILEKIKSLSLMKIILMAS